MSLPWILRPGIRWDKRQVPDCCREDRKPSFSAFHLFFFSGICSPFLSLAADWLSLFLVQMVENSLCKQFQCLHVLYSREQTDWARISSKSRFPGKRTLWPNLCQVYTLDPIDCGGLGQGQVMPSRLPEAFSCNPTDSRARGSFQRKGVIGWTANSYLVHWALHKKFFILNHRLQSRSNLSSGLIVLIMYLHNI